MCVAQKHEQVLVVMNQVDVISQIDRGHKKNASFVQVTNETYLRRFAISIDHGSSLFRGVVEGDGVLIAGGDPLAAVSFARIYRIRAKLDETTFFRWRPSREWRKFTDRPRCDRTRIQGRHGATGVAGTRGGAENGFAA